MRVKRQIRPEFNFRFAVDEITAKYGSAEGAFAAGDFLIAAQLAEPDSEVKGCALVLGGLTEQGLALLSDERTTSVQAALCRALALWLLDRSAEARSMLENQSKRTPSGKIDRFRRLLDRDDINVFITGAMLPVFRDQHTASMLAPSYKYGPITAKYVASQMVENAYEYRPSEPFDEFIGSLPSDERPDFLFSLSPQWLLARNFHKVRQPKLLWCHDTDMFVYRNSHNFSLYDIGICGCTQEHFELSRGAGLYSVANIMSNPLNMPFPDMRPPPAKQIDVIFSGSSLDHFHAEKPRFIYQLAELNDEHVIRVIDGHVPEKDYFDLLASAKFLTMVGRQAGAPSPRWRDALANGSCLLFPEGTFYDEVAPGCFPYRATSIGPDIRLHLKRFDEGNLRYPGYSVSEINAEVDTRFAEHRRPRERLFECQLKYAAFLALVWRDIARTERLQRRHVWLTPGIDSCIFGRDSVREKVVEVADHIEGDELCNEAGYNNAALLYAKLVFTFEHEDAPVSEWSASADRYFAKGVELQPDSLLLLFNRAHWEFFKPGGDHRRAAKSFQAMIDRFEDLIFDPCGVDVGFVYTLLDQDAVFPYYEYADAVTTELVLRNTPELNRIAKNRARDILLSACHGYVGWSLLKSNERAGALERFETALDVFPHGLPLLRLDFETRLDHCASLEKPDKADVAKVTDAFFAVANVYPTVLLTHIAAVVPLLAEVGEGEAAQELLAGWYRLGNIIHAVRGVRSRFHDVKNFEVLYHYRHLLPARLKQRIDAYVSDERTVRDVTQFEQAVAQAARSYSNPRVNRRLKARRWRLSVIGDFHRMGGLISAALLWRAFKVWLHLPPRLKRIYLTKAWVWTRKGDMRQAFLRAQLWGATSMWSRGIG